MERVRGAAAFMLLIAGVGFLAIAVYMLALDKVLPSLMSFVAGIIAIGGAEYLLKPKGEEK